MVKDSNYFVVHGWMINKLDLKGIDLMLFSIIFGFTQDDSSLCTATIKYYQGFTGASRSTIMRSLQNLVSLGFIERNEVYTGGVKFNHYRHIVQNDTTPGIKMTPPRYQNDTTPGIKMTPNNILDNTNDKRYINAREFLNSGSSQFQLETMNKNVHLPRAEFDFLKEQFILSREEAGAEYTDERQILAGLQKFMNTCARNFYNQKSKNETANKKPDRSEWIAKLRAIANS